MDNLFVKHVGKINQKFPLLKLSNIWNVSWMKTLMIDAVFDIGAIQIIYVFTVTYPFDGQRLFHEPIVSRSFSRTPS
jgi:hypothetical protein